MKNKKYNDYRIKGKVFIIDRKGFKVYNLSETAIVRLRKHMVLLVKEEKYEEAEKEIKEAFRKTTTEKAPLYGIEFDGLDGDYVYTVVKKDSIKYKVVKELGFEDLYEG